MQTVGCPGPEADVNRKVFWISSHVYNESLCLRQIFFFKFFMFIWQLFSAPSSSDTIPVLFFHLRYPVTSHPAAPYESESLRELEVWWQNDHMNSSKAGWAQSRRCCGIACSPCKDHLQKVRGWAEQREWIGGAAGAHGALRGACLVPTRGLQGLQHPSWATLWAAWAARARCLAQPWWWKPW